MFEIEISNLHNQKLIEPVYRIRSAERVTDFVDEENLEDEKKNEMMEEKKKNIQT